MRNSDFTVTIHIVLARDGSVRQAEVVDSSGRYAADPAFHAIADSTRRAVLVASPLQVPPGQYDLVKDLTLDFSPRDLGQ
jgi:outer membrane biosynthesis protein TonB